MMSDATVFKPRRSNGAVWLAAVGILVLLPTVGSTLIFWKTLPWPIIALNLGVGLVGGVLSLALAVWFPTMGYTIDAEALTLRCGPLLNYRIPLKEVREVKTRSLSISMLSSLRLPGVALFSVYYNDVGFVKMCASSASEDVLLIETDKAKYGLTPADEGEFVEALKGRLEA